MKPSCESACELTASFPPAPPTPPEATKASAPPVHVGA